MTRKAGWIFCLGNDATIEGWKTELAAHAHTKYNQTWVRKGALDTARATDRTEGSGWVEGNVTREMGLEGRRREGEKRREKGTRWELG